MKAVDERKLARTLIRSLAESFLQSGDLVEADFQDEITLVSKVQELFSRIEPQAVIDHRGGLLDEAGRFSDQGKNEMALMLYAMFLEHTINGIIVANIEKKRNLGTHISKAIIRQVNLEGKLTWLPELLGLPVFNKQHLKWVKKISEERNSFVHYKWLPIADEFHERDGQKMQVIELVKRAKMATTYMKKYEARCLFDGQKGKIKKALDRGKKRP